MGAAGQPACLNPRRHCDYWLLLAECLEQKGDLDGAEAALQEALEWKCKPIVRIHEAMDRLEKRRLLVKVAMTPTKQAVAVSVEPIKTMPCMVEDIEDDDNLGDVAEKYNNLIEKSPETTKTSLKLSQHAIIDTAAKAIAAATTLTGHKSAQGTPKKPVSVDRGTKMVLTPLRASKRVRSGTTF